MNGGGSVVESLRTEWRDYRRGLLIEHAEAFDSLWERAQRHEARLLLALGRVEMVEVFLLMLLEQEHELQDFRSRLQRAASAHAGNDDGYGGPDAAGA